MTIYQDVEAMVVRGQTFFLIEPRMFIELAKRAYPDEKTISIQIDFVKNQRSEPYGENYEETK
jgi:hypothetical protein